MIKLLKFIQVIIESLRNRRGVVNIGENTSTGDISTRDIVGRDMHNNVMNIYQGTTAPETNYASEYISLLQKATSKEEILKRFGRQFHSNSYLYAHYLMAMLSSFTFTAHESYHILIAMIEDGYLKHSPPSERSRYKFMVRHIKIYPGDRLKPYIKS